MFEKTLKSETVFKGKLLKLDVVHVELESGESGYREIISHPGASVILGKLPDGRFAFVRQYRKPVEQELIEAVAGCLEEGETPEECARRELIEETGHKAVTLTKLGHIYTSPGFTDETLHVYYAELDPEQGEMNLDEDENLDIVYLNGEQVDEIISSGRMTDAKTLAAWLLYSARIDNGSKA